MLLHPKQKLEKDLFALNVSQSQPAIKGDAGLNLVFVNDIEMFDAIKLVLILEKITQA